MIDSDSALVFINIIEILNDTKHCIIPKNNHLELIEYEKKLELLFIRGWLLLRYTDRNTHLTAITISFYSVVFQTQKNVEKRIRNRLKPLDHLCCKSSTDH